MTVRAAPEDQGTGTLVFMTVAVWGESFLDLFLDFVLPSYLAPGMIPELPRRGYRGLFWLYTTAQWEDSIRTHASFRALEALVEVRVVAIDRCVDISGHGSPYETMNACHLDFIAEAEKAHAAMVFFSPDAFWSDGSLRHMLDLVERGRRAVLMAGVRARKDDVLEELAGKRDRIAQGSLDARTLVRLLMRHPHRITESLEWNASSFDIGWPSHLYWPVADEGMVARCFHLHTFYVHPRKSARPEVAHDFDWLAKIGLAGQDIEVVADSDRMFALELSPSGRSINGREGRRTLPALADWICRYAQPDHRRYVRAAIHFHAGEIRGRRWFAARLASAWNVRAALLLSRLLDIAGVRLGAEGRWQPAPSAAEGLPRRLFRSCALRLLAAAGREDLDAKHR